MRRVKALIYRISIDLSFFKSWYSSRVRKTIAPVSWPSLLQYSLNRSSCNSIGCVTSVF